jgi:hypothetical protein
MEMESRKRRRESEDSFNTKIQFFRNFIILINILITSGFGGILNYSYLASNRSHHSLFQLPSQFILGLSVIGFAICGLFAGIGTKLLNGGFFSHAVYGIPSNSAQSWLICFFILVFTMTFHYSKKYIFSYLLSTTTLYVKSLDDSYFIIFGFVSTCFCSLVVFVFFYCVNVKKLEHFYKTKRGKLKKLVTQRT